MLVHSTTAAQYSCLQRVPSCMSVSIWRLRFWDVGSKIHQFKPIFSMPLKWNTRWGPLSPSVDTTAGTKPWPNVALSPYQRTCLEDECVQQRGIIDQLQETESADLGTFPREDDNYLKIMNSISSSVSLKLHSVEHSRCSPPAMWVKLHYMSTFRFCPTNRIKKRPALMVSVCVCACMLACEWLLGSARSFSFVRVWILCLGVDFYKSWEAERKLCYSWGKASLNTEINVKGLGLNFLFPLPSP